MPVPDRGHPAKYRILAALMAGTILGPIDSSIVNVILPTITGEFSASLATAEWVPMVYLLTIGSLVLFFGRLGDIWGYRKVFLAGLLGFVVTSCLCGASPTIHWLIVFRAFQGVAAGMLLSVPLAMVTGVFPAAERGKALGLFAVSISVGLATGPSLGGFLTAALGWRAAFFINLPVGLAAFAFARKVLPDMRGRPGPIDLRGAFTGLGALAAFLLFVNRAQETGLTSATGTLLAASLILGTLFLRTERRATEPMLDLRLFRSLTLTFGAVAALLNFMSQYVVVFLTPFYLQRVLGAGAGHVGLVMTAFPLAVLVVAPFAGALSDRIGTSAPAALGTFVGALACFLMAGLPGAGDASIEWKLALFGVGMGLFQSPNNSAVMGSAPREQLGVVSSLLGTMRTVGMVLGVAAAGAFLYAVVPAQALRTPDLPPAEAVDFLRGLRHAYVAGGAFASLAAILSVVRGRRSF
jgi:EmrB/QacA subfamily drug resistance transporter